MCAACRTSRETYQLCTRRRRWRVSAASHLASCGSIYAAATRSRNRLPCEHKPQLLGDLERPRTRVHRLSRGNTVRAGCPRLRVHPATPSLPLGLLQALQKAKTTLQSIHGEYYCVLTLPPPRRADKHDQLSFICRLARTTYCSFAPLLKPFATTQVRERLALAYGGVAGRYTSQSWALRGPGFVASLG